MSDFFYVWSRRSLSAVFPTLFGTLLTPKSHELIASPYRHVGGKKQAEKFFERGLSQAFQGMHDNQIPDYPMTVFYAFKQVEKVAPHEGVDAVVDAMVSTGWETMLAGLCDSGFAVHGTWPMRSEQSERILAAGTNALATSIVLVCRPRSADAPSITRGEFIRALRSELPPGLRALQHGNIAPVDLAQATIGPGMAIFSRYSKVLEPSGDTMRVRAALQLINQELDHVLTEQEAEYGPDTRWAVSWFEQFGMSEGEYGNAEVLARARDVSITGLDQAGIVVQGRGKVRLKRRDEMNPEWDPALDTRVTVWEMTQHLIRRRDNEGEPSAADLLARLGGQGEAARDLAYRLYTICERKGWAQEAIAYNSLVIAWPEIQRLSSSVNQAAPRQQRIEM